MLDSLTHMRDLYLLLGVQQRLPEQSLQDEHRIPRRQGQRVSPDDPTVAIVGQFFISAIEKIISGTYIVHSDDPKTWSEPQSVTVDDATIEDWTPHFDRKLLDDCVTKYTKLVTKSCWVRKQREKEAKAEGDDVEASSGISYILLTFHFVTRRGERA
jgi:hypothetical protein